MSKKPRSDSLQAKGFLARAWYYLEPWVIFPWQRPMEWQGLVIRLVLLVAALALTYIVVSVWPF